MTAEIGRLERELEEVRSVLKDFVLANENGSAASLLDSRREQLLRLFGSTATFTETSVVRTMNGLERETSSRADSFDQQHRQIERDFQRKALEAEQAEDRNFDDLIASQTGEARRETRRIVAKLRAARPKR